MQLVCRQGSEVNALVNKYYPFPIFKGETKVFQRIRPITYIFLSVLLISIPTLVQADNKPHTFELRVECRKNDSGGCTARATMCANAPAGYYFSAGATAAGADAGSYSPGHQPVCEVAETGHGGTPVAGGLLAPTSMCALLHGESGGGVGGIGKVYYTKCSYTTTIYPIPK